MNTNTNDNYRLNNTTMDSYPRGVKATVTNRYKKDSAKALDNMRYIIELAFEYNIMQKRQDDIMNIVTEQYSAHPTGAFNNIEGQYSLNMIYKAILDISISIDNLRNEIRELLVETLHLFNDTYNGRMFFYDDNIDWGHWNAIQLVMQERDHINDIIAQIDNVYGKFILDIRFATLTLAKSAYQHYYCPVSINNVVHVPNTPSVICY